MSRIREEYERTGDGATAIATGLERVGRSVTAAAVLISIVFLAFLLSEITLMKAFGVGLPLVVLLDATLVRGALLPAAMKLGAGRPDGRRRHCAAFTRGSGYARAPTRATAVPPPFGWADARRDGRAKPSGHRRVPHRRDRATPRQARRCATRPARLPG